MKNGKKIFQLSAFTVQELLIGMVISSLVIGFVYGIYVQLGRQLITYQAEQEELMAHGQFSLILSHDVMLAKELRRLGKNGLVLKLKNSTHLYSIEDSLVSRDRGNGIVDTFFIKTNGFVLENEVIENSRHQTLKLKTSLIGQEVVLYESKKQSIADEINKMYLNEY